MAKIFIPWIQISQQTLRTVTHGAVAMVTVEVTRFGEIHVTLRLGTARIV